MTIAFEENSHMNLLCFGHCHQAFWSLSIVARFEHFVIVEECKQDYKAKLVLPYSSVALQAKRSMVTVFIRHSKCLPVCSLDGSLFPRV